LADYGAAGRTVGTGSLSRLALDEGAAMSDKSPRNSMTKKSGKSLKEKRAEKKSKANAQSHPEIVPSTSKKH
jgi:hypothetical protein